MADGNQSSQQVPSAGAAGLDPKLGACLSYLCGWITGLIFLALEKDNKEVRFHAWQSIFVDLGFFAYFVTATILGLVPIVNVIIGLLSFLVIIGYVVLKVILMIKAFQGQRLMLPVISDYAQKQVG